QPEDVLIIGSDGRDDILLGHEENGTRIINEDEQQFLRRIEDGRGRLEGIEQAILAQGELTDDFTLIRISYREGIHEPEQTDLNHSKQEAARAKALYKEGRRSEALKLVDELLKQDRLHPEAVRAVARICIREKQFDRARDLCLRVTEELPTDSNFLYYTSYVLKHLQEYEAPAEFGERGRLREPQNVQSLVNLADIYRLMGNEQRAEMLIDLARNINPDHDHVKQYLAAVQR
ncbi:MAG: tetratricopeptide repeat protein, partial [Leptospiraceae bacterium]|nr:tetratricopeptide repeat protein [Leptospiraceae bacterium]